MKSSAIRLSLLLFVIQTSVSAQNAVTTITDSRGDAIPAADGEPGSTLTEEQILITFGGRQEPQVPWKVSPAAEPKPAFRYEFWPRESALKPGSGLLYYFRAVTSILQRDGCLKRIRDISARNIQTTAEDRAFIASIEPVFDDLRALAYCEDLSWDNRNRDIQGPELYYFKLDDVQFSRDLARLLMVIVRNQSLRRSPRPERPTWLAHCAGVRHRRGQSTNQTAFGVSDRSVEAGGWSLRRS